MGERAVVVGSGPGGATAAMVLARAGWDVTIIERGVNHYRHLERPVPTTSFANDELKMRRGFGDTDWEADPRTYRPGATGDEPFDRGAINNVPQTLGGGSTQWDAKTPRFWDIDFAKLSMLGPIAGADVVDWPFSYDEIAPYYDAMEVVLGVAGSVEEMDGTPASVHAPRSGPFPLPPGVQMYSSLLLAEGCARVGLRAFPFPEGILSRPYDGRPACINCGFCSGFGCTMFDRTGALVPLRHGLATGRLEILAQTMALRVVHERGRAEGVAIVDADGAERTLAAQLVVLACGPIDTVRLALLSELPDPGGLMGRGIMFHWFTAGYGIWDDQLVHAERGRATTQCCDDFCDPDFEGARVAAAEAGLPYFRGGVLELGGTETVIGEALQYVDLMEIFSPAKPFGRRFKQLMRVSALRERLAGVQMIAEDLAQLTNTVDLDPAVRDHFGLPAARITYAPHRYELAAQEFYSPRIEELVRAAGAAEAGAVPQSGPMPAAGGGWIASPPGHRSPVGKHIMGGMRMGADERSGVTDPFGRLWGMDNVVVADGSVFPTSGAHNPTLTIFATTLRNARAWAGEDGPPSAEEIMSSARSQDAAGGADHSTATDGSQGSADRTAAVVIGVAAGTAAIAAGAVAVGRARAADRPPASGGEATENGPVADADRSDPRGS